MVISMGGCDDLGAIHFGTEIRFSTNGNLHERPAGSVAESPFQLKKPLPVTSLDRETVKISVDHPLACSTPLGLPVYSDRSPGHKMSPWAMKLAGNLRKTARLARETAQDSRSLFDQSNHSLEYINRSMMGQMQYIQDVLDGIEERINNEDHMEKGFWKSRADDYSKSLHPLGHTRKLEDRVHKIAHHISDHTTAAANIRRCYAACDLAQKSLDQSDKYYTQVCDQQILPSAGDQNKENVQAVAKLNTVLYQVADSLQGLRQLAPKAFRVDEKQQTLGNYLEKTLCRIRTLEWAIGRHFPPQPTPVPSQQSTTTVSCNSTSSIFSGTISSSQPVPSSLSVISISSTQSGGSVPWNLAVSPVTAKSTQSISSLLTAVSSGSTDGQKTAKEMTSTSTKTKTTTMEQKKTKRKTNSHGKTTPIPPPATASPHKMI